jgi:hypothetical protein
MDAARLAPFYPASTASTRDAAVERYTFTRF